MEKIAKNITEFLIANKMVSTNKEKWCIYILQKKLLSAICKVLIIIISIFSGYIIETLSFCITFIALRKKTGGIHMNSSWLCIMASSIMVGTIPIILNRIDLYGNVLTISLMLSIYIITKYSPINHPNIHFNSDELLANNGKAKKICIIIVISYLTLQIVDSNNIANCIALAVIYDAISMLLSKLLLQEVKNEH